MKVVFLWYVAPSVAKAWNYVDMRSKSDQVCQCVPKLKIVFRCKIQIMHFKFSLSRLILLKILNCLPESKANHVLRLEWLARVKLGTAVVPAIFSRWRDLVGKAD